MVSLSLSEAVGEIKQACQDACEGDLPSPFFLLVGAGISHPPVPLAGQIVEECKTKARELGRFKALSTSNAIEEYSFWFIYKIK